MIRVAAIDCGTNSIRLLVADVAHDESGPHLTDVHREMRVVRLGEGVDRNGRLQPAAIDRTWAALSDYTAILKSSGAVRVRMAATSASRDASNSNEFVAMVNRTLGQDPEIITGIEEAELSFRGAVGDLDPATGPFLVADIGGGSTELVVGTATVAGEVSIDAAVSVDLGSVRITERILHGDPPTAAEIALARRFARETLRDGLQRLPVAKVRRLVAVSGTSTTVAAAAMHLAQYDPVAVHLATIGVGQVHQVAAFMLGATTAHRGALGYIHPGRVDVIGGGALILSELVDLAGARTPLPELTVSEHDILDGLALSLTDARFHDDRQAPAPSGRHRRRG